MTVVRLFLVLACLVLPFAAGADETEPGYAADIKDRLGSVHSLEKVVAYYPSRTLFGGGGDERVSLIVKAGAAEVTVPFNRIRSTACGERQGDRVAITIRFRDDRELTASVAKDVEIRGENGYGVYRIAFADIEELTFR